MKPRERFISVLNLEMPDDRLPKFEWATWWTETLDRWMKDGLVYSGNAYEQGKYFGHDPHKQFRLAHSTRDCPKPSRHGAGIITSKKEYDDIKKHLFPTDAVSSIREELLRFKKLQEKNETAIWVTLDGYFWFPRSLFGIEPHFYSFYDHEELYLEICRDLCSWQTKIMDEFCSILIPDFMTLAEDMSYNNGPMLSKDMFTKFLLPFYRQIIPTFKKRGIKVFVDTDGDVTKLIDWLIDAGVDGLCPLERQAGVDVCRIKRDYPDLLLFGGYDKTIMHKGEEAMRKEFERIMPAMKSGGYIPSVDHQTPPDVSLDNYKLYCRLLDEYCRKAVQ